MISTQPLPNFAHRVVELRSNSWPQILAEVARYEGNGYTIRIGVGLIGVGKWHAIVENVNDRG